MRVESQNIRQVIPGLRIMVVDDVKDCRDLLELYLTQIKVEVQTVDSARKALNIINEFQPELIISDICMAGEDGYWLMKQLNKIKTEYKAKIPAIALTALAKEKDRGRIIAAGYDGYLAKPFLLEDLTGLIVKLTSE